MPEMSSEYPCITGYTDRWSVRPGETLQVKVGCAQGGAYEASLVRIRHADPNPRGDGVQLEKLHSHFERTYQGQRKCVARGSCGVVPEYPLFWNKKGSFGITIQVRKKQKAEQILVSTPNDKRCGWVIALRRDELVYRRWNEECPIEQKMPFNIRQNRWYKIWISFDETHNILSIGAADQLTGTVTTEMYTVQLPRIDDLLPLVFGGECSGRQYSGRFDGRLEDPFFSSSVSKSGVEPVQPDRDPHMLAWWDFSKAIETQCLIDRGPLGLAGRLINVPTRGVRGSRWDGTSLAWTERPDHYAAIHFHSDDLYDCQWDTDFIFRVPHDMMSGVYGIQLKKDGVSDIVPFFVIPSHNQPKARICYLAPTFTYLAYANHVRNDVTESLRRKTQSWGGAPYNPIDYPLFGYSTYNTHPDGSGHSFSSRLRPVLNFRPGFLTFTDPLGSGLRHFSADSHLTYWLENNRYEFDVITDEDLHREGSSIIRDYDVVITGSHPEYQTPETLDALADYVTKGGALFYLGGNGFYWRVAQSNCLPGMIELRRAEGGVRAWAAEPGEAYHTIDKGYGGLWRRNGRPPQALVGVGFSAQGPYTGSYYRRTKESYSPQYSWLFRDIDDEIIGKHGFFGGGTAGYELDRADYDLGTPEQAIVLARSESHGDGYIAAPEELLSHIRTVNGEEPRRLVRGEIVYTETEGGGTVLAVGSILFIGGLNYNRGNNPVSKFIQNALEHVLVRYN